MFEIYLKDKHGLPEGMVPEDTIMLLETANDMVKRLKGQFTIILHISWVEVSFVNSDGIKVTMTHNFGSPSQILQLVMAEITKINKIVEETEAGHSPEEINAGLEKQNLDPSKVN